MSMWLLGVYWVVLVLLLGLLVLVGFFLVTGMCTVPWIRTKRGIAHEMLKRAGFKAGDYILDLGSGDGAIVFEAVRQGGSGTGVEQIRLLVWYARVLAQLNQCADRATFTCGDILKDPLPIKTTIISAYLFSEVNAHVEPRLREQFPVGTRVVSRDFLFPTLKHIETSTYGRSRIYVYEL